MKKRILLLWVFLSFLLVDLQAQSWIVKDSILVFPEGFNSWLKRNNGGIDPVAPGMGNYNGQIGNLGTNQGVDLFDFNKDGLPDLTFQLFPSNNITREYIKGIFIQNSIGKFVLDTNFVIKAKGDMWLGNFGDFNGDGLNDYHYIIQNYHGADSNRKYSPEMIHDNWPEKVFLNNGKGFDTLTLDVNNLTVESTYVADIDKDGADEIIATDRGPDYIIVYKYDKIKKQFFKTNTDISDAWKKRFDHWVSRYPLFNVANVNSQKEFAVIISDSSNSKELGEPDWQPFNFKQFTYAKYNFNTKIIETIKLNRDSILIPVKYSREDADDYYRFCIHEKICAYKMDIDNNGEEEIVVGGFYMNNYYVKSKHRYAYGWKVLGLNGKDLTTQFFKDSGFDKNTELLSHGLDIDEKAKGMEMIPGSWGNRGWGELGNYYKIVNGKFEKTYIRDIKHVSGKNLDSTYFKSMEIIKYPNFTKNKNALVLYDMDNLKRAAIIYQASCDEIIKPTFNTTKYSFCSGDSLKLTISNVNKGDSLKWYYGTKSDVTNVSNKTFTDSTKLFVTRTDSLGCVISSDTIQIKKFGIPSAPNLSRDTANFLVSGVTGTTWYKDGSLITDTTQKFKPATPGSYTAKTTQNGCVSALSAPYYYLVTDIINLSKDEYIKLAPNPFVNQLNFDFIVKGYQRLNMEVYDIATGTKVVSHPNITAGSTIPFGQLSSGTYIIRITSNDNKILHQYKMVKL